MTPTHRNTYPNTDRQRVLNFVQSLSPSAEEAPYLASALKKSGLSMCDARLLLEYVARRAAETPLQRDSVALLGLPRLPHSVRQEASQ